MNPEAIPIPAWPLEYEQQTRVVQDYNNEALQRFEQMSEGDALPNMGLLDALVKSIVVNK